MTENKGSNNCHLGSENRVGMTSKIFQKRIRNGGRVRKKLQRGGAMNQINVQMSARSLGFYLCCMIKNFFKKIKGRYRKVRQSNSIA